MVTNHATPITPERSASLFEQRKQPQKALAPASDGSSYAHHSDPQLIQACLDGQQAAWDTLIERYGRLVYSIPFAWGLSKADADDVFQNVFTIVYRRLGSLRDQSHLSGWLITVTKRECWHLCQRNQASADLDETIPDSGLPPVDKIQEQELKQAVRTAVNLLDNRSKYLLQALFFEVNTPSYEKIAAKLGLAVGSIGSARARSLKKLEAILLGMGIDFR